MSDTLFKKGYYSLSKLMDDIEMAVRDAYGWHDLPLEHDFYETLPENDLVRYTISTAARKERLKRLLAENHRRAATESAAQAPANAAKATRKRAAKRSAKASGEPSLFDSED